MAPDKKVKMARILKIYPNIALNSENVDGQIDFVSIFGRNGAVHVEIGTGKGTFLLAEARARPEVNFLGIEWANKYYRYAVDRLGRWQISNVRLIRTDAAGFISEKMPDESVDCFHIYFPDPWPKKRHHKRRFIQTANFEQLLRCLKPAGVINIATDHDDYFGQIKNTIEKFKPRLKTVDFIIPAAAENGELVGTNYERKYIKENRSIHFIAVKKKSGS